MPLPVRLAPSQITSPMGCSSMSLVKPVQGFLVFPAALAQAGVGNERDRLHACAKRGPQQRRLLEMGLRPIESAQVQGRPIPETAACQRSSSVSEPLPHLVQPGGRSPGRHRGHRGGSPPRRSSSALSLLPGCPVTLAPESAPSCTGFQPPVERRLARLPHTGQRRHRCEARFQGAAVLTVARANAAR